MIYGYLKNLYLKGKLSNSWLIESDNVNEALTELQKLATELLTSNIDLNHNPDFILVKCEGANNAKSIQIEQIRTLQNFLYKTASLSKNKVAIIFEADKMNINSANSMLKVLEDTPKDSYIFLLVYNAATLLPTVKSRCAFITTEKSQNRVDIDYNRYIEIFEDQNNFVKKEQMIKEFSEKNRNNWCMFANAILLFINKIAKRAAGAKISLSLQEQKIMQQLPRQDLDFLLSKYDQINQLVENTKTFDLEIKASTILLMELLYQNKHV